MSDVKPVAWLISGVDARNGNPWRTASLHNAAADYRACEDLRDVTVGLLYSQETIDALQAEIESLRKDAVDAARWRALQKNRRTEIWTTGLHAYVDDAGLDEQADAAIAKEK